MQFLEATSIRNIHIIHSAEIFTQLGVGCKLGINVMNVQAYADDIVLMAPSASGLQKNIK